MPTKRNPRKRTFDKYFHYINSVQGAAHDADLLLKIFRSTGAVKQNPILREDFCGTAALCFEWVQLGAEFEAIGIDLDPTAIAWGKKHLGEMLPLPFQKRVTTLCEDVFTVKHEQPADVVCAMNFSYGCLKERKALCKYFSSTYAALAPSGLFVIDAFGGPQYLTPTIERRRNKEEKFTYWWEIKSFDALSHDISCRIHFQKDGEAKRKNVFKYEWRLWTVPELRDILMEAGFSKVEFWAEGLNKKGQGNGRFRQIFSEKGCDSWVCLIAAHK